MDVLSAGWREYKSGVTKDTQSKQLMHFEKWRSYTKDVGIRDVWLRSFCQADKNLILSGFAHKIRTNCYGKVQVKKTLMGDTVVATLNSISTTFRENAFLNPQRDDNNEKSIILQRQIRGYRNLDPPPNSQVCLPLSAFQAIYNDDSTPLQKALGELTGGALFFACRSCEYSKVNNSESRKTKILRLRNIQFYSDFKEIKNKNSFHQADIVRITFESQKTEVKNQPIIQHRTSSEFCPVKIWAALKTRILSYPRTTENSKVNLFLNNKNKLVEITSEEIRKNLRRYILSIDPFQRLYNLAKVGTHSIRSSTAMILHCAGVDTYIIKLIGRWASEAFMKYIRHQLVAFSRDISTLMVNSKDPFFNLPFNSSNLFQDHDQSNQTNGFQDTDDNQRPITRVFTIWR